MRALSLIRRDPEFRRFWSGMLLSRTGDAFTTVALSWLVLGIAGPAELGVVLLCSGLPRLVSGPIAGHLLDRWQPRVLLGWDNLARAVLIGVIPLLHVLGIRSIAVICVVAACSAVSSALTEVAESALVPRLVDDDELETANTLLGVNWEIAAIAGPPLSGFIVAWTGPTAALVVDAVSFAVMSAICFRLPEFHVDRAPRRLGFGALGKLPTVVVLTLTTVGFLFLQGMAEVFYPVFSRDGLGAGPGAYGLLIGATGVGALLGVACGRAIHGGLAPMRRIAVVLIGGAPLFGALAFVRDLPVAVVLTGLASFLWGPYYVLERSLVQRLTPGDVRGQVMGARTAVSSLGFPLGSATAGLLLAHVSLPTAVLVMAAAYVMLGLAPLFLRLPRLVAVVRES
ncbi:MFS transporter [Actinokineospora enzanensis]|uniref:MFS transporter n=1 Tax=Actinokineospora enzanensis TaxID=155975 RepID=UPI00039DF008|nr:MFS transporter [Actinokineospora enzanensis]